MTNVELAIENLIKKEKRILIITFIYILIQLYANFNTLLEAYNRIEEGIMDFLTVTAGICFIIVVMMLIIFIKYFTVNYQFRKRVKEYKDEETLSRIGLAYIAASNYLMGHLRYHLYVLLGFHAIYLYLFIKSVS